MRKRRCFTVSCMIRERDIIDGKPILTETAAERPVSQAAKEIYEDLITYKRDEEEAE